MERNKEFPSKQLNNKGFSLVEVLIAVVILVIVSIPILHSFFTATRTNADAKILFRATQSAENLMEDIKYLTFQELTEKYAGNASNTLTDNGDGSYTFQIQDTSVLSQALPDGYRVEMNLNPNMYSNANALNLSDFSTVSASDSAVYTMEKTFDDMVYQEFVTRNENAAQSMPTRYEQKDLAYFKENLQRTITVSIVKRGTVQDEFGDDVPLVNVNVNVTYLLRNYVGILPQSESRYEVTDAEMFDNGMSNTRLNSVFVFYNPRYLSGVTHQGDRIVVENVDNVPVNLYVVAQEGAGDTEYQSRYYSKAEGLRLTVIENPESSGFPSTTVGATTLRTNLNSGAPYSSTSSDASILCSLTYQNLSGTLKTTDDQAGRILNIGDETGKSLSSSQTVDRIYKVITTVWDNYGNEIVSLDGTRLNHR